jgi:putative ABC transport system permease protein
MFGAIGGVFDIEIYAAGYDEKNEIINRLNQFNAAQTTDELKITFVDRADSQIAETVKSGNAFVSILWLIAAIMFVASAVMFFGSVYSVIRERTREIGVMRAFGTSRFNIRRGIMIECGLVGLLTGIFALIISATLVILTNPMVAHLIGLSGKVAVIAWWHPIGVLVFGVLLALAASLIPVIIGTSMQPVNAINQ